MAKLKLKPDTILPTEEEDAMIRKAVESDPDTLLFEDPAVEFVPYSQLASLKKQIDSENRKKRAAITITYSSGVLDAFKSTGAGWQMRMDLALQDWLRQHRASDIKL